MFRDDTQKARVCNALTFFIRQRSLWCEGPPSPNNEALELLRSGVSHSEAVMLRFAWSIWNNCSDYAKGDSRALVSALDNERMRMVGSLLVAMADDSAYRRNDIIDRWLYEHGFGQNATRSAG